MLPHPAEGDSSMSAGDDRLTLPDGAFIALRQSGGLRFSTREVMVYTDGQVTARYTGKLGAGEGSRRITPAKVADLQAVLKESDLFGLPEQLGQSSPDGYAYELIARLGRQSKSIEFFTSSIPAQLQPLLAQLKPLMAVKEEQK